MLSPTPFVRGRMTRFSSTIYDYSFQFIRFNTNKFSRCLQPYTCKLWNQLPNSVIKADK